MKNLQCIYIYIYVYIFCYTSLYFSFYIFIISYILHFVFLWQIISRCEAPYVRPDSMTRYRNIRWWCLFDDTFAITPLRWRLYDDAFAMPTARHEPRRLHHEPSRHGEAVIAEPSSQNRHRKDVIIKPSSIFGRSNRDKHL